MLSGRVDEMDKAFAELVEAKRSGKSPAQTCKPHLHATKRACLRFQNNSAFLSLSLSLSPASQCEEGSRKLVVCLYAGLCVCVGGETDVVVFLSRPGGRDLGKAPREVHNGSDEAGRALRTGEALEQLDRRLRSSRRKAQGEAASYRKSVSSRGEVGSKVAGTNKHG